MREILFRGKRIDNGEWVEGWLSPICKKYDLCIAGAQDLKVYPIDPETVGQYTGLTDKNGKKIFEGDVVKDKYGNSYVVKYDRHGLLCCGCCYGSHDSMGFYLCDQHNYALSEENAWDDLEIIGNIHDNPELLKGGADNG